MTAKWKIVSYHVDGAQHGDIVSSIGRPYAELTRIAKRMSSNGEGQRYRVVKHIGELKPSQPVAS